MSRIVSGLAAIAVFLIAQAGLVNAAEVKVFSTIGVQAALEELAPKFEQATGNKLNITWATAAILVKRVQAGETADLMVLTKQSLDAGPLPADLNNITVYAAGVGAGSQHAEAATALIRFLHSPEAQAVFKAKGLKPADAPKGT